MNITSNRKSFSLLAASLLVPTLASGVVIRHDVPEASYFDLASNYSAAVKVFAPGKTASGTLVSSNQILVAAHTVDVDGNGVVDGMLNEYSFAFGTNVSGANADLVVSGVVSIDVHPLWGPAESNRLNDMAVVTLSSSITVITPMNISAEAVGNNAIGTMVGYGRYGIGTTNTTTSNDGRRRAAQNLILLYPGGRLGSDFDNPDGTSSIAAPATPLALEGSTAGGDSGGPLLVDFGNGDEIAGVLSSGFDATADDGYYGDVSLWAPISNADNLSFLAGLGITPIPEPSSMTFLGLLGFVLMARRR